MSAPIPAAAPLLSIRDLRVQFGGVVALNSVSLDVERGQVCSVIGPNGAGKTTIFNCLSRIYTPQHGEIVFDGQPLLRVARHQIASIGIGRTFQNLALFRSMTVMDNIMVGGHRRLRSGFLANALRLPRVRAEQGQLAERSRRMASFARLDEVLDRPVSDLPFGIQKRVELARALTGEPSLLLLDEPAAGLNHQEVEELRQTIRDICERLHTTVLLVEHHMHLVMAVSDKIVALNFGEKLAEGTPAQIQANPAVIAAYLGTKRR
jgi:branched-chain amino acid transport system ATP-binding protein